MTPEDENTIRRIVEQVVRRVMREEMRAGSLTNTPKPTMELRDGDLTAERRTETHELVRYHLDQGAWESKGRIGPPPAMPSHWTEEERNREKKSLRRREERDRYARTPEGLEQAAQKSRYHAAVLRYRNAVLRWEKAGRVGSSPEMPASFSAIQRRREELRLKGRELQGRPHKLKSP